MGHAHLSSDCMTYKVNSSVYKFCKGARELLKEKLKEYSVIGGSMH